jgi:choloylglycine hydrolase
MRWPRASACPEGEASEYTSWTRLGDLDRGLFFVRSYDAMNYSMFDLRELKSLDEPKVMPLAHFDGMAGDATATLAAAR